MNRITNNLTSRKRHKKILKLAKGYKGSLSKLFISANQTVLKALKYSYVGRKNKKRNYSNLWTKRINLTCKANNINYNSLKQNITEKKLSLNKKILAKIFLIDEEMTNKLFETVI
jgi:large subunit ribosomal protein L20